MAFEPIVLKNADLILGDEATGTDFAVQLTSVTLTADVATERIKTIKPEGRFASVDDPEWTLELGYVYGRDNTTAPVATVIADYLLDNNGEQVPFTFRPISGGPPVYTGQCRLVAGSIGGDQGAFSTQTVSLPVDGQVTVDNAVVPAG